MHRSDAGRARLALAVGLVLGVLAAGAAGVVGGRAWAARAGTPDCPRNVCLRQVWTPAVSRDLGLRSRTCPHVEPTRAECSLTTAFRSWTVQASGTGRHPSSMTVRSDRILVDSVDADLATMQWVSDAVLADRPGDRADIRGWLAEHVVPTRTVGSLWVTRVDTLRFTLTTTPAPATRTLPARTLVEFVVDTDPGR